MKKIFAVLFCLNLWIASADNYRYELALVAIFQDEASYLKEWIEFHRLVGVEHFYLFNNLSSDNYREVLDPYIRQGIVELVDWNFESSNVEEWNQIQCRAYEAAIAMAGKKTKWLA